MEQSPASFVNAMEGAALRERRNLDHATFLAWHTAVFAMERYSGKLKPLSEYLGKDERPTNHALQNARGIAFFHRLQAQGIPVKITRH